MLATLSAALLLAAAPEADPEPPPPVPAVKFRGVASRDGHAYLTFEVINSSSRPVPYFGYTCKAGSPVISPLYTLQQRKGKAWKETGLGWCGTGVGPVSLPARGKVTFTVSVPPGDWDELKVGLRWHPSSDRKEPPWTAWSDGVTRKAAGLK